VVDTPTYDCSDYKDVPVVDAHATMDEAGELTIFAVNRDMKEDAELTVNLGGFEGLSKVQHILLHHDDVKAINTEENPDNVSPVEVPAGTLVDGKLKVKLPAISWNVIRVTR
jgi:alpha-N-arabinofuranosidase